MFQDLTLDGVLTRLREVATSYEASREARDSAIREAIRVGVTRPKIAEATGLSVSRVNQIGRGQTFRMVT